MQQSIRRLGRLFLAFAVFVVPSIGTAQITSPGTDYVSFWSGELRIFAQRPNTQVEIVDIDTNMTLSPTDSRIVSFGAATNPFTLASTGDMFVGRGGTQSVNLEIRVRILATEPVTVWTGDGNSDGNSWGSYLPASFESGDNIGSEIGRSFVGFTRGELIIVAPRVTGMTTEVTVDNLDAPSTQTLTFDGTIPPCPALVNAEPSIPVGSTPCYLLDDPEVQTVYLGGFTNDRILVTSNVDISLLTGFRMIGFVSSNTIVNAQSFGNADWSASPPSFAPGDDGVELGTLFYAFVRSGLAIFPTQDDTTVTITDLSDGDDSLTFTLASGDPANATYDLYTPHLKATGGGMILPRAASPQVFFTTNMENPIDNDVLKVEADKPVIVHQGPAGNDTREFADVAFSIAIGPDERLVYSFAENGGDSNDLQLFAFQRDTQVSITSLSTSFPIPSPTNHDFTIDFNVPVNTAPVVVPTPAGSQFVANPTAGDIQHFGSEAWEGELLRIVSTRPITVIGGDYDGQNFGAYIPFISTSLFLPPTAVLLADPTTICPGESVDFDGSQSFDEDMEGNPPDIVRYDWDFGDGNTLPDGGPMVNHTYDNPGTYDAALTVTDNEDSPNTQTDTDMVTITVLPFTDPTCNQAPTIDCPTVDQMASVGVPLSFVVTAMDDPGDTGLLEVMALPAGASMAPPLPDSGNPVSSIFQWTPTNADVGSHVVIFTATDLAGDTASCTVTIDVRGECFLVLGSGPGVTAFTPSEHTFWPQVAEVEAYYPVLMNDIPEFPLPTVVGQSSPLALSPFGHSRGVSSGVLRERGLGGYQIYWAQVLMWNPEVFPGQPEQWTQGMRVIVTPQGRVYSSHYGDSTGMSIWTETGVNAQGEPVLRFPFSIPGS